ncbi:MAG: hypothetical protein IKJ32_01185 [Clostridia bacterium]|nr:hypothetical protein [Clostridia bacterium]
MDCRKKEFLERLKSASPKEFKVLLEKLNDIKDYLVCYPFESDPTYSKHEFITNYLKGFGISYKQDGFYYLRTALGIAMYEIATEKVNFSKLSKMVAKRHSATATNVNSSIFRSLNAAFDKNHTLFECFNHPWHAPGATEFICRFAYYAQDIQHLLNYLLDTSPDMSKVFNYPAISAYMANYALPADQAGYKYIREALYIMLSNSHENVFSIYAIIKQVAENFNVTTDAIKVALKRCLKAAYADCPEYFENFDHSDEHPLHYQFIAKAANELGLVTCSY